MIIAIDLIIVYNKSMDIKMIASDLDGTLLKSDATLSDYTLEVLNKAEKQGIKITVASGRALYTLPECVLNLECAHFAITSNGACIYDLKNKKALKTYFLKESSARRVIEFALGRKIGIEMCVEGRVYGEKYYFEHPEEFGFGKRSKNYLFSTRIKLENFEQFFEENAKRIQSIDFILKEPSQREEITKELSKDENLYITSSHKKIMEFSHSLCGKENALAFLLERENCKSDNLVTFGNADNDIGMIEFAKTGVATANSPKKVKRRADFVCGDCDNDGVAIFIDELLKK